MIDMNLTAVKIKYLIAVLLYGTIGFMLHFVSLPTEIVVFFRAFIGFVTLLLIMKIRGVKADRQAVRTNLAKLIISGIFLGLNWVFLFASYRHTTVAIASLCNYMAPIIIIVVAPLFLPDRISFKKFLCVLAAVFGMVLISGVFAGEGGRANPVGIALGIAGALCFVGLAILNRQITGISFYDRAELQLLAAAVVVLPFAIRSAVREEFTVDARSVIIVLVLGVVHTGVAYCFYFDGLARLPLTTYAVLGYLEPVTSVLFSVFLLHERMSLAGLAGTVLIIGAALASELISAREGDS